MKNISVSVAQLSMVEAAEQAERESGCPIGNPLRTLAAHMEDRFGLEKR
jgi:hypothetical protein